MAREYGTATTGVVSLNSEIPWRITSYHAVLLTPRGPSGPLCGIAETRILTIAGHPLRYDPRDNPGCARCRELAR
jgi:hypothetical protein